jgi:hypothetical protein
MKFANRLLKLMHWKIASQQSRKLAAPCFTGISLLEASQVGYALRHLLLGTGRLIFNECVFDAVLFCLFHDRRNAYVT